jgi:alkylhydroperoxidase/carboxymuconolactone decarboxylase family protein YurZ
MMKQKMGDVLPAWSGRLKDLAPDLLVATGMTSAQSVGREASSIPPKYRHLMAVAAALGMTVELAGVLLRILNSGH